MAVPSRRAEFWAELIRHLAAIKKNESWLARRLEVPVQTLSSWKQRNQFRRACLPQLGELLHWEGLDEESAARLGVELIEGRAPAKAESHPTEEVLRRINREYRIAEKMFRRYAGHTAACSRRSARTASMPSPPARIRPTSSRTRRTATRSRWPSPRPSVEGTLCLYIRPNEEGVSYYRDTWGYGQLVYQEHAIEEIAAFRP